MKLDNDQKTMAYVKKAIMHGVPRDLVSAWAAQQSHTIADADLDRAYAAVVEEWIAAANAPEAELYALHVARREDLYRRAMALDDLALAHKILVDLAKIQMQYKAERSKAQTDDRATAIAERIKAKQQRPSLKII